MKKVLIAGAGSYIGENLKKLLETIEEYQVRTVDMCAPDWRENIKDADSVVLVAGIAHQKETKENAPLYYKVNRDMAAEAAKLSKAAGAGQFVFLSSMSVYGINQGHIDENTPLNPLTHYGKSKLAAEALISTQADERFKVAILRPPMVFGPGCRGNYPKLSRLAKKLPCFPLFKGQRSMVFIDHLCQAIYQIVENQAEGYFFPQDRDYYSVDRMVKEIRRCSGKNMLLIPGFGWAVKMMTGCAGVFAKVFGSLTYDRALPGAPGEYQLYTNKQAIEKTEAGEAK